MFFLHIQLHLSLSLSLSLSIPMTHAHTHMRCAILIGEQNSPPFTTPIGFGSWKTLSATTSDTYNGALSQVARCGKGRFHRRWAMDEQAYFYSLIM